MGLKVDWNVLLAPLIAALVQALVQAFIDWISDWSANGRRNEALSTVVDLVAAFEAGNKTMTDAIVLRDRLKTIKEFT